MHRLPEGVHHQRQSQGIRHFLLLSSDVFSINISESLFTNTKLLAAIASTNAEKKNRVKRSKSLELDERLTPTRSKSSAASDRSSRFSLFHRRCTWAHICLPTERRAAADGCHWIYLLCQSPPRTRSFSSDGRISFTRIFPRRSLTASSKR